MKRVLISGIAKVACACSLMAGCARPPQQEISNAQNALESAKEAKAPIFADGQFKTAQALVDSALAEIRAQNMKSPFSHDYQNAKKMLLEAASTAEAAIAAVPKIRAKISEEAKTLLDKIKPMIIETDQLLEYPIQKKNKEAFLFRLKLNETAASLPEDISKVPDETLIMTRGVLGRTLMSVESVKKAVVKLNPSKKIVKPAPKPEPKKGKKKRR